MASWAPLLRLALSAEHCQRVGPRRGLRSSAVRSARVGTVDAKQRPELR